MENVRGENFGGKQIGLEKIQALLTSLLSKCAFVIVIIICSLIDN